MRRHSKDNIGTFLLNIVKTILKTLPGQLFLVKVSPTSSVSLSSPHDLYKVQTLFELRNKKRQSLLSLHLLLHLPSFSPSEDSISRLLLHVFFREGKHV